MNQPLPPDLQELEQLLSSLAPCELDGATSHRLMGILPEGSAHENSDEAGLDELERHLCEITPATMRTDVLSRMVKAMDGWHEYVPMEEKVVAFSDEIEQQQTAQAKSSNMVAAAAAVALLGAATALVAPRFFPGESNRGPVAVNGSEDRQNPSELSLRATLL